MDHRNIARFEIINFVADDSEVAISMMLHGSDGETMLISCPTRSARGLLAQLDKTLQADARERGEAAKEIPPTEYVDGYAAEREDRFRQAPQCLSCLRAGTTFCGAMTPADARRLAAQLQGAAEPRPKGPAN